MDNLTTYKAARADLRAAQAVMDAAHKMISKDINRVYAAYATAKSKVSTRRWPIGFYNGGGLTFKITDKWVKVHAREHIRYGAYAEFDWKFPPAWLELDDDALQSEIREMLNAEGRSIAAREHQRKEDYKASLLADIDRKMEQYNAA